LESSLSGECQDGALGPTRARWPGAFDLIYQTKPAWDVERLFVWLPVDRDRVGTENVVKLFGHPPVDG
jgi:hypothetical protein